MVVFVAAWWRPAPRVPAFEPPGVTFPAYGGQADVALLLVRIAPPW